MDNLKVGQFIYLLLTNPDIRDVIDTITSKSVLILGNFSRERKPALDAMREAIRQRNLTPIVFDFEIPENRDVTDTVKVLAGLAKFVVADNHRRDGGTGGAPHYREGAQLARGHLASRVGTDWMPEEQTRVVEIDELGDFGDHIAGRTRPPESSSPSAT